MEEKKEQAVVEFVNVAIRNIDKYFEDHEDEIADAIVTDELVDCSFRVDEAFGCDVFGDNEEFNEMLPRILIDCLEKYYIQ